MAFAQPLCVLLSGTSSDAHTWNLVALQLALEEAGHTVHNLGPCVPDELLRATCLKLRPDVLVLSSVNGHGAVDAARALITLRKRIPRADLPVAVGGLLDTDGGPNTRHRAALTAAGADIVFEADGLPELLGWLSTPAHAAAVRKAYA